MKNFSIARVDFDCSRCNEASAYVEAFYCFMSRLYDQSSSIYKNANIRYEAGKNYNCEVSEMNKMIFLHFLFLFMEYQRDHELPLSDKKEIEDYFSLSEIKQIVKHFDCKGLDIRGSLNCWNIYEWTNECCNSNC